MPPRRCFQSLDESIAESLRKGVHVLVDGLLVSSKYEHENGKSKKAEAVQFSVFWSVRANSVRRLSRAEAEVPPSAPSTEACVESGDAPY
jgi:single-stranded DNA-binding protein